MDEDFVALLSHLGLRDPVDANALAWMAGLLWTLVISVRLAVRPGTGRPQPVEPSPARVTATV